MTPDIALAASTRDWPDRLHRHLLDHGGGRVVTRVMGPEQAVERLFDVLLIDDVCSFLTPHLISSIKSRGSAVIGVYSPVDGSDAKRRLLECGISDVLETGAPPEEFLEKVAATVALRVPPSEEEPDTRAGWSMGFMGSTDGVGATEVAVGLARDLARTTDVALIDADPVWPSVAQRLDLPLHPNIRTALDVVLHGSGDLSAATQIVHGMTVVGGVADGGSATPPNHVEVAMLLDSLGSSHRILVVDLGAADRASRGLIRGLDALALIGTGDPVGVTRLIRTGEWLVEVVEVDRIVLVVNRVPRGRYFQSEVRRELAGSFGSIPIVLLPEDNRVGPSVWEGRPVGRGPFKGSLGRMSSLIHEEVGR